MNFNERSTKRVLSTTLLSLIPFLIMTIAARSERSFLYENFDLIKNEMPINIMTIFLSLIIMVMSYGIVSLFLCGITSELDFSTILIIPMALETVFLSITPLSILWILVIKISIDLLLMFFYLNRKFNIFVISKNILNNFEKEIN